MPVVVWVERRAIDVAADDPTVLFDLLGGVVAALA
jgi:hypothetical protein